MSLAPDIAALLNMAAVNNGFDRELSGEAQWLGFASSHCSLRVWLTATPDDHFVAALSQLNVTRELDDFGAQTSSGLPAGALGARVVADLPALHRLLRRAFSLSKTLPDELLHAFEKHTRSLPKTTEAERLVVQRIGQDIFRAGLIDYWEGRCAVTGLAVVELLRASHIKPWADCDTDDDRLNVFNGLLLAPHLDAAFDQGFLTVSDDGAVIVSPLLKDSDRTALGLDDTLRVDKLTDGHRSFLAWHRGRVFRGDTSRSFPGRRPE